MGNWKWLAIIALAWVIAAVVALIMGEPRVARVLATCSVALSVLSLHER